MKRAIEDPIGLAWARDHLTRLSDEVGLVETLLGNSNLILHQLLDEPGQPFRVLLTLYRRGNGAYLVSLRSRDGTAGRIAERLQGGGHPNASGAVLPRSIRSFQDAVLYLQQTIAPSRPGAGGLASLEQAFEAPSAVI
jgi:hypothetical protein